MRISGSSPMEQVPSLSPVRGCAGAQATSAPVRQDSVQISSRAREIAKIKDTLRQLPEVREDRVADLRAQLNSSRYNVPASEVAKSILTAALQE